MPGIFTHLSVEPPLYYARQGETTSIELRMYHKEDYYIPGLTRITFALDYNPDDLEYLDASPGTFLSGTPRVTDHHGTLEFEQAAPGNGAYGEAALVHLNFRVRNTAKPGDFLLILHDARFTGANGDFVPGLARSGQFIIRAAGEAGSLPVSAPQGHHHDHLIMAVPNWLFWSGAVSTILVTFVMAVVFIRPDQPDARYPTYDLLKRHPWLKSRRAKLLISVPAGVLVVGVISAGLLGPHGANNDADNLAPYLTWSFWWVFVIFLIALVGNLGGIACPWEGIAGLAGRFSLNRPWPKRLNNLWLAALFFFGFIWLDLVTKLSIDPIWTVGFWLVMLLLTASGLFLFDRASWCRYGCPFGRVFGLYSMVSMVEVRARDKTICAGCKTEDCFGACPTFLSLKTLDSNRNCIGCLDCVRACPVDNATINLRPFGAEFMRPIAAEIDEGFLVVLSLYAISVHSLTLTPAWAPVTHFLVQHLAGAGILMTRTLEILLPLPFFFAFFLASAWASARLGGKGMDRRRVMLVFVYCLLPIALAYHLAHNLGHLAIDLPELLTLAGRVVAPGWRFQGPLFDLRTIWYGSVILILLGHVIAVFLGHRTAAWLFTERRRVVLSQLPVLGVMVFYTLFSLWLVTQPLLESGLI